MRHFYRVLSENLDGKTEEKHEKPCYKQSPNQTPSSIPGLKKDK
jgi:hypothetical protein